jgi:hypothetical protein
VLVRVTVTPWQRQALKALGLIEDGADHDALAAAIEKLLDAADPLSKVAGALYPGD